MQNCEPFVGCKSVSHLLRCKSEPSLTMQKWAISYDANVSHLLRCKPVVRAIMLDRSTGVRNLCLITKVTTSQAATVTDGILIDDISFFRSPVLPSHEGKVGKCCIFSQFSTASPRLGVGNVTFFRSPALPPSKWDLEVTRKPMRLIQIKDILATESILFTFCHCDLWLKQRQFVETISINWECMFVDRW